MSLRDEIKILSGNKRKYLLMRIVDMNTDTALKLCGIKRGTYNTYLQNQEFVSLHRRIAEFSGEYKQEAIQLLRRDNQLAAVLLEGKLINKMKDEIDSGEYELIRTNLAREVYSKLITDLDVVPKALGLTWEQRIRLITNETQQIEEGEGAIDGEFIEANISEESQPSQSHPVKEGGQGSPQDEEKAES